MFEYFITYARYDRYNIICSLVAHYQIQPAYEDYETSMGDSSIPKIATKEALKALVDTHNFIDVWINLFEENYDARCVAYINDMKGMFKQIPQTISKPLTTKQKVQKLMKILVVNGK